MLLQNRLIRLPSSGAIFNEAQFVALVRQEIGVYGLVLKECPVVLKLEGKDIDYIVETIGVIDYIEKPVVAE